MTTHPLSDEGGSRSQRRRKNPTVLVEGRHWKADPDTGCWQWQLSTTVHGYGHTNGGWAHRVMWCQSGRPLESGVLLHHVCRNKGCINPEHLEVTDSATHMRMHRREYSKLTLEQAAEIKRLVVAERELSMERIGARFGVTGEQVKRIARGLDWSHELGGPIIYSGVCPWCGEPVITRQRRRRFCSDAHRSNFNARKSKRRHGDSGQ